MIVRFSGATLGLLAFSVAVFGGLWAGNPATVILSRAIWSVVIFCALGLVLGFAAQAVISEYARRRFEAVRAEVVTKNKPLEAKKGETPPASHSVAQKTG